MPRILIATETDMFYVFLGLTEMDENKNRRCLRINVIRKEKYLD
jgi:hypothetical protein